MKTLLFLLIICLPLQADEISKEEVLKVARETRLKIDAIKTYEFTLTKREFVDGRDTGYQYLKVKVNAEPLQIYIKYFKPASMAGREALYKNGNVVSRRGGTRTPNMVLNLTPKSPLAMRGNRYPITHMNPKTLSKELIAKIENELKFEDTYVDKYERAKLFGQVGTYYKLKHAMPKDGMQCRTAEVLICDELKIPIYFKITDWYNRTVEEYAFGEMKVNAEFPPDTFNRHNREYGF